MTPNLETPPMVDELKPCPFCGGKVALEQPEDARQRKDPEWWGVVCRNTKNLGGTCAIQQRPSRTKEAAVERWNTRTPPEVSEEMVERAELAAAWCDGSVGSADTDRLLAAAEAVRAILAALKGE